VVGRRLPTAHRGNWSCRYGAARAGGGCCGGYSPGGKQVGPSTSSPAKW
jgi:hypothetical protein